MISGQYILLALFILHLIVSAFCILKIVKTTLFTDRQKIYNVILAAILPFFWAVLIYYLFKRQAGSYEIEVKNDISSNGFHESGKGMYGSGGGMNNVH